MSGFCYSLLFYLSANNVTTRAESMCSRSNDINESSSILSVQRTVFFAHHHRHRFSAIVCVVLHKPSQPSRIANTTKTCSMLYYWFGWISQRFVNNISLICVLDTHDGAKLRWFFSAPKNWTARFSFSFLFVCAAFGSVVAFAISLRFRPGLALSVRVCILCLVWINIRIKAYFHFTICI